MPHHDASLLLVELGLVFLGLAALSRAAARLGTSAIPLYLLVGLAFGNGGILPLRFGEEFVRVGAEVGVILLLFMLGLEYTGSRLLATLRTGLPSGIADLVLNFTPGFIAGAVLGFPPLVNLLLGGVTYISSSGVVAKLISEWKRQAEPETPTVISILVMEDLAMAVYLPIVGVLLAGHRPAVGAISVVIAVIAVFVILGVAVRYGERMSAFVAHQSDDVVLLSALGLVLLVAGCTQKLQVSAAIGAFLVGVAMSGPVAHRAQRLVAPLRDLFAATFFLFFGLQIDPSSLTTVLPAAAALVAATSLTKIVTGWWAVRRAGLDDSAGLRAGCALVARGEFSIVIAGLGAATDARLGPLSAAYVLISAIVGPALARLRWQRRT